MIHTVGPVYSRSEDRSGLLAAAHANSLRVADELEARSVAFPAISTGVYGYPAAEAAMVALTTVRDAATKVEVVTFVLFSDETHRVFEEARRAQAE